MSAIMRLFQSLIGRAGSPRRHYLFVAKARVSTGIAVLDSELRATDRLLRLDAADEVPGAWIIELAID